MKFSIFILLVALTIASYEAKPTESDVNTESTTITSDIVKETTIVNEAVTVQVEVVKDAESSEIESTSTEQTVINSTARDERSAFNKLHLNDELDLKLSSAGDTTVPNITEERLSHDVELATHVKGTTEASTVAVDDENHNENERRAEKESDVGIKVDKIKFKPKPAEDLNADNSDVEVRVAKEDSNVGLKADLLEDEEKTYNEGFNKTHFNKSSTLITDKENEKHSDSVRKGDEDDTSSRRMLDHQVIDTKARSGYEANSDEPSDVYTEEDDAEVRSAQPLDSPRRQFAGPSIFPHSLAPVRPDRFLKPLESVLSSYLPSISQHNHYRSDLSSIREDFTGPQNVLTEQQSVQNAPKLSYYPDPKPYTYHNSYPYVPPTTTLKPVQDMDNLISSWNFDKIFMKLLQASRNPAGYRYPNTLQSTPASYNYNIFSGFSGLPEFRI